MAIGDIDDDALRGMIESLARVQDLALDPAWMPAVLAHTRAAFRAGELVGGFELADDTDLAPVFRA